MVLSSALVVVTAVDVAAVVHVVAFPLKVEHVNVDVDGLYVSGPVVSSTYNGVDVPAVVVINGI